VTHIP